MTSPERLEVLDRARVEFEAEETTLRRRTACLRLLRICASEETPYKCMSCKQAVFYVEIDINSEQAEASIEGLIYSFDGLNEYKITQLCEYCFDQITMEDEESTWLDVEEE